jgi:hypothetical protein
MGPVADMLHLEQRPPQPACAARRGLVLPRAGDVLVNTGKKSLDILSAAKPGNRCAATLSDLSVRPAFHSRRRV